MTASPPPVDLAALETALAAATSGPWQWDPAEPDTVWDGDPDRPEIITVTRWDRLTAREDASLIVAAVTALPALIAVARRAAAQETRLQALAEEWEREADDDERWLNSPRVSVGEAQSYPATIQQARAHVGALRAVLDTQEEA